MLSDCPPWPQVSGVLYKSCWWHIEKFLKNGVLIVISFHSSVASFGLVNWDNVNSAQLDVLRSNNKLSFQAVISIRLWISFSSYQVLHLIVQSVCPWHSHPYQRKDKLKLKNNMESVIKQLNNMPGNPQTFGKYYFWAWMFLWGFRTSCVVWKISMKVSVSLVEKHFMRKSLFV